MSKQILIANIFSLFCNFGTVCLGAAAAGTGLAWTSPVGEKLKNEHSVVRATEAELPWIASFLAIGAIVGALPCGILSDKLGRKKAAMLIAVPYILSYLIIVFAKNVPTLYVARFLVGKSHEYVIYGREYAYLAPYWKRNKNKLILDTHYFSTYRQNKLVL